MLRNYLKIAWRNLVKNKVFSFVNIAGLATGLACFVLIALYVVDELSYDRYNKKISNIYRINSDIVFGGNELTLAVSSDPMGPTLKKDYPQVEEYVRIYASSGSKQIKKGDQYITEAAVAHADSTIFQVFTLPAIQGDTETALNEPNTVVITGSTAEKYFGTTNVVGSMIETDDNEKTLYKITAVIKDIPKNSHFNFDFIFSMDNVEYGWGSYLSHNFHTYILLKAGTDYKAFEKNFPQVIDKYVLAQAKQMMEISSMDEFRKAGNRLDYSLMPLKDIHLRSNRFPELSTNGNIQYVYIFSAVAFFILIIACINFMNLSTARSSSRAKEVGIRKVLGTERKTLVRQFLAESTLTSLISLMIAVGIAWLALPYFNDISGKSLTIVALLQSSLLPFLLVLPFVVGLLAGLYPAFFLSSFRPVQVLKGKINSGVKRSYLRSTLVVFQFSTSIFLMIGTIVVFKQLNYIQSKQLGFSKEQVLIINNTGALGSNLKAFKQEILNLQGVTNGTISGFLPVTPSSRNDNSFSKEAVMDSKSGFNMQVWKVDEDYIGTLGMSILKGRNFSKDFGTDSSGIILNETAANFLGYDNPVGKTIYASMNNNDPSPMKIIGVVRDFHFSSLREKIAPLSFILGNSPGLTSFKVSASNIQPLVKQVEQKWSEMAPSTPFSYRFMDESFDNMYRAEQRVGKVALSFAILAIVIACLGLFGLATYMAEQRTKEIGVRKVLGATVNNIVTMLSKDFLKLVIISSLLAFPAAWWFMHEWLKDFAFRVSMGWWIFALAAVLAITIAFATISFQAVKAAIANPVKSLRTE